MDNTTVIRSVGILNRGFLSFFSASVAERNISYSEGIFLVNIGGTAGISQEALSQDLVIDKAAAARAVKSLSRKGYIRTERSAQDKRIKKLYLSATGKELFEFLRAINARWIDYISSDLSPKLISSTFETLSKMSAQAKIGPPPQM